MDGQRLPGADRDDEDRIILHVDMDCFYASCERLREPDLAGKPVVVGMGYEPGEKHGAVATASYEARAVGVESAQPIGQALEALPRAADGENTNGNHEETVGHYRPVDLEFYKSVSADVRAVLHDSADVVRKVSIDEAYLDVTDRTSWAVVGDADDDTERTLAAGYARHLKQRIDRAVGVPASVGVAPNMSTAKIASDFDKPDGLTVVQPAAVQEFLEPLSVHAIHGVGPVTASELAEMGIETAGELAAADGTELVERFGERGRELHARARGEDDREVTPTGRPKSLSRESAFTEATADHTEHREKVRALAADVADRARSRGAMYRTIGIKVVTPPFESNTRASSLSGPVDNPTLVERIALDLLSEFGDERVRKLGVRVSNLSFADGEQVQLGGFDSDVDGSQRTEKTATTRNGDSSDEPGASAEKTADGSVTHDGVALDSQLSEWIERYGAAETVRDASADDGQSSLAEFEEID